MAKVTNSFLLWTLELRLGTKLKILKHFVWAPPLKSGEDGKTNCGDRSDTGHPSLCFSPPPQPEMLHQVGSLFLTEKILDLFCSDSSFLSCKYTYIIIFSLRHYHQHLYLVLNHIDSRYNILISIGDDFSGDGWFGSFKADRQCLSGPEGGKMSRVLGSTDWGIWIILAKPAN